jgi:hypothetical protein
LDGLTDVANTIGEITETPWKESFIKITASLDTVKNVKEITREVEWYEDIDDDLLQDLIDIGLNYESLVSTTDDLTKAWQLLFKGIKSGGMSRSVFLSASAQKALMTAKSVFIGLAISATVDTVESAVKLATDAHGLTHAWTTARIPILRELKQVDNRMRDRDHTMGDGHYHYWLVIQDYQMKTLAFEGSRRYWQAIADSTLGAVWNFFGNAQSRAEKYGRWAEDANEMAKLMLNIYGSTESTIRSRANTSVNATFASRPSRQIVGPNRRGLTE